MRDFLVLPVSHPFLMKDDEVIEQTIQFLTNGCFMHEAQESSVGDQSGVQPEVSATTIRCTGH